jgi:4-hydroxy-tetrahydrodipicolinate synthase
MELIPAGLSGIMPGMGMADGLNSIFKLRAANKSEEAFQLYGKLLPFIVFAIQNFELWLYCEKRLLKARGLLESARCRDASIAPDPNSVRYLDEMSERVVQALADPGFAAKA